MILIVTEDARERERGVTLVKADQKAESMPRFAWLVDELPKQIPGLMFSRLPSTRSHGTGVESRHLAGRGVPRRLSASLCPSRPSAFAGDVLDPARRVEAADLARTLPGLRTEEQTILTGKGAVVAVLSFNDEGRQRLVELLQSKGYRIESGREAKKTMAVPPAAETAK